jgi:hypothetical protein
MNEFFTVATKKLPTPLTVNTAAAIVEHMARLTCVPVDAALVLRAIRAGQRWQLSHWMRSWWRRPGRRPAIGY